MTAKQHCEAARRRTEASFDFCLHRVFYVVMIGTLLGNNLMTRTGHCRVLCAAFFRGVAFAPHAASTLLISQTEAMIDRVARHENEKVADARYT